MKLCIIFVLAVLLLSIPVAQARYNYGGGSHSGSHGGHYSGGFGGSSHRGGTYHGPHGGYGRHK